jgi:hypothetical protein
MKTVNSPRRRSPKSREASDLVADQPRITVRLPLETKARLMALSTVTGVPAWQLINVGIDLLWKGQEEDVRALVGKLAPRLAARYLKGEE